MIQNAKFTTLIKLQNLSDFNTGNQSILIYTYYWYQSYSYISSLV